MRKMITTVCAVALLAMAVNAMAADQTIYLKGSGKEFTEKWNNVFYLGGVNANTTDPNVWHLVYSGKKISDVTELQVTFTNGKVFKWNPALGFSINGGGNNFGWVIKAPADWVIAYVDKGNNNQSSSFLVTNEAGNGIGFNISGIHKGMSMASSCCDCEDKDDCVCLNCTGDDNCQCDCCKEVIVSYDRYLCDVWLWNKIWTECTDCSKPGTLCSDCQILSDNGGLEHYFELLAFFGEDELPNFWHFEFSMKSVYDGWADDLEVGLRLVLGDDYDLIGLQMNFDAVEAYSGTTGNGIQ